MQYLIYPFILLAYFEFLGRWIMFKLKKDPILFNFIIGFISTMAFCYIITWPITVFNLSFYYLVYVVVAAGIASVVLIIKDFKKISIKFKWKSWLLFFILLIIEMTLFYHRTLGEPHGFDVLHYVNMIGFNMGNKAMNTFNPYYGTYVADGHDLFAYVFQSYYYFVPVIIYCFRTILSIIDVSFEILPAYVWGFQLIHFSIFIGVSILSVEELIDDNKLLKISLITILVLFLGNLYYNNSFGFIGNNYRMSIHAISTLFLYRYFNNYDRSYLWLFYISMLGMCGISSSATFSFVFVLYGLFFTLYATEKDLLKQYTIVLYVPTINILVTQLGMHWWIIALVIILFGIIYLMNDFILKLFKNEYIRIGTVFASSLLLIILSFLITGNIFDFNAFLNNHSEIRDMSWDYFMFNDTRHWLFNSIVLLSLFYYIIKEYKKPFSIVCWVLIIVIFNPFGCTFMNKINWVYYRSYDIIINNFTIVLFVHYLLNKFKNNIHKMVCNCIVLTMSVILSVIQIPMYYHYSFKPTDDYNYIYKISNSELEVIMNVKQLILDKGIESPNIITSTFWMPSFIKNSTYLFGREKRYNYDAYDKNSYELYLIFFPVDGSYDFFRPEDKPDYKNTIKYLDECDYDILVVDNGNYYYDEVEQTHKPITSLVEANGKYQKTTYSTAKYAVYYLGE